MSEQVEEIIDIEEDKLKYRVEYIRDNLMQLSDKLRDKIPQGLTDQDLTQDDTLKIGLLLILFMTRQLRTKLATVLIGCFIICLISVEVILLV